MADMYHVSHTKMSTFRRCLQQYKWKYMDKRFPPSSMGQLRGSCGHLALAEWHRSYDSDKATQEAWQHWEAHGHGATPDWQILEESLARYYDYSREHDKFKLEVSEQEFEIELNVSGIPFEFSGYIDGIVKEKNTIWLLENKFYKRMQSTEHLFMDQQVSLYLLASHLLGYEAVGVLYNMVRVADTKVAVKEPVVRARIQRNPAGLGKVQQEMAQQVIAMLEFEQKGGSGAYRNPTKDCNWDCPFHSACLVMTDDGAVPEEMLDHIATQQKGTE